MKILDFLLSLRSSLRRRYIFYFRKGYMKKMLARRKGGCEGCGGICCIRTRPCPYLKDGKCSLYKKGIPYFCKVFPIDQKDIDLAGVSDVCQYYWEKKK